MAEHEAVVPVERDDRLVCVGVVDGDGDDVSVVRNGVPARIGSVRSSRDVVQVNLIEVEGDLKCVLVDKKRVHVDRRCVARSRDDVPEPIDVVPPRRNRVSRHVEDVSADESAPLADRIVVQYDRDDVEEDRDVVDALRNVDQVRVNVVDVDRDVGDRAKNDASGGKNVVFFASGDDSWLTSALPSHSDGVHGFRDALDVDIDAN